MSAQKEQAFARAALEDKALRLWCAYYSITERYDRTVCTGSHHGEAVPANSREAGLIGRNAREVDKRLRALFAYYGITPEMQAGTKEIALRLGFYEQDMTSTKEQREMKVWPKTGR